MSTVLEQKTIQVNGIRMGIMLHNFEDISEQKQSPAKPCTLVLLHGFTGNAASWGVMLDNLTLSGLRIVALDMLGHGQSDAPNNPQRYAMEHCQQDILAVLSILGIGQGEAILLGYSMGGRIALSSAFSGFFRALILESASAGLLDAPAREQRRASDNALADSIERDGVASFVERWEQFPLFASQRHLPAETRNALHQQRLCNQASGLVNSLRGVGTGVQPPLHDRLPQLTLPVLLITGQLDSKFCSIAQQMVHLLPNAILHIVQQAGHTVHLEQPALFATLVNQFCQATMQDVVVV